MDDRLIAHSSTEFRTMHFAVVLSVLISLTGTSTAQELKLDHCICNDGGVPSDSTFTFRGRLSYWNGNPSFRIWPVGTTRLLGIRGVCLNSLDLGIWNPYHDHELWADFTVSTITPREHGVMQFVCIRSIKAPFLRKKPG